MTAPAIAGKAPYRCTALASLCLLKNGLVPTDHKSSGRLVRPGPRRSGVRLAFARA